MANLQRIARLMSPVLGRLRKVGHRGVTPLHQRGKALPRLDSHALRCNCHIPSYSLVRWCITRTLVRHAHYPRTIVRVTPLISLLSDVYRMSEEEEEALEGPAEGTEEEVSEGKG